MSWSCSITATLSEIKLGPNTAKVRLTSNKLDKHAHMAAHFEKRKGHKQESGDTSRSTYLLAIEHGKAFASRNSVPDRWNTMHFKGVYKLWFISTCPTNGTFLKASMMAIDLFHCIRSTHHEELANSLGRSFHKVNSSHGRASRGESRFDTMSE